MEKLSLLIQQKVDEGAWSPISVSRGGPAISHLLFADDCLLMVKAKTKQVRIVKGVLDEFCRISGMSVNFDKSNFMASKNITAAKKDKIVGIMGIRATSDIKKYLGFRMLNDRVKKEDFNFLIEKLHRKLAGWKAQLLSKAGRVVLAKSVLASVPLYNMQTTWIPKSICDKMDSITRSFIWQKASNRRGLHLVNWNEVTKKQVDGGLGLPRLKIKNISLLGKLVWSLLHDHHKLWVQVLISKYLNGTHVLACNSRCGDSSTWKAITKTVTAIKSGFHYRIGSGDLSLWFDRWLGEDPLCSLVDFVDIQDLNLRVKDVLQNGKWNLNGIRTMLSSEVISHIKGTPVPSITGMQDSVIWGLEVHGNYSSRSAYQWLFKILYPNISSEWQWSWIWRLKAPANIVHFLWLVGHNAVPTREFLTHRHIIDDPICMRCMSGCEDILHVLRDCVKVRMVWEKLGFTRVPEFWTLPIYDWLKTLIKKSKHLFLATIWWLWRMRNAELFAQEVWSFHLLMSKISRLARAILDTYGKSNVLPNEGRLVNWHPPPDGSIKVNTDGSSLGNPGASGFGGVLRDASGDWIQGFCGHLGHTSILHAELVAICEGLKLCANRGASMVICESDSEDALKLITSGCPENHKYAGIVADIRSLLTRDWSVEFLHTLREGNRVADFLAKHGA